MTAVYLVQPSPVQGISSFSHVQKHAHQQAQVTRTILLREPSAIFIVSHSALLNLILDYFLTTITTNGGTEAQQSV
jgi:hypothetical protein